MKQLERLMGPLDGVRVDLRSDPWRAFVWASEGRFATHRNAGRHAPTRRGAASPDLTRYRRVEGHGVCYHGRTKPTAAACACGRGCGVHCNCALNRARRAREQADLDARNAASHARDVAAYEAHYARLAPR